MDRPMSDEAVALSSILGGNEGHNPSLVERSWSSAFAGPSNGFLVEDPNAQAALQVHSSVPTANTAKHSNEVWERHRNTITQLYVTQGKKLWQVMQIMESEHGFKAK
jgi:hypothetical protein